MKSSILFLFYLDVTDVGDCLNYLLEYPGKKYKFMEASKAEKYPNIIIEYLERHFEQ